MTRRAIGIMVHQAEVKAAYLTLSKGMLSIEALETVYLKQPIDEPVHAEPDDNEPLPFEAEDEHFEINDPYVDEEDDFGMESENDLEEDNTSVLFSLIHRLTDKRLKVAFSMPPSMVRYGRHHLAEAPDKRNLARRLQDKLRPPKNEAGKSVQHIEIINEDDSSMPMLNQFPPPLFDLLQEVNTYTGGKLRLQLLDTNELALIGLVRDNYALGSDDITALVHIESDFSRIIFLRGRNVQRMGQMINEPFNSPDLLNIIQSKIIYEQDESEIPDLNRILISGKGAALRAREYMAKLYPDAEIGYVYSKKMGGILSEDLRGEIFSEFAVPIALAAKTLEPKNPNYSPYNLLPDYVLDRQKVLKLAPHGYGLLLLLALVAFGFTYAIISVKSQIRSIRKATTLVEAQMGGYTETLTRVSELDSELVKYDRLISLADSLGRGQGEMLAFLDELNQSVESSQAIWINEISRRANTLNIKGLALNRSKIPVLSSELGNADLKRVTRTNVGALRAFAFELEKRTRDENLPLMLGEFPSKPGVQVEGPVSRETPRRTPPEKAIEQRAKTPASPPEVTEVAQSSAEEPVKPVEHDIDAPKQAPSEDPPVSKLRTGPRTIESATPDSTPAEQPSPKPALTASTAARPEIETTPASVPKNVESRLANPEPQVVRKTFEDLLEKRLADGAAEQHFPSSGEYTIEIGIYEAREQAVSAGKRLGDTGFGLFIQRVLFPKKNQTAYRLILGAFSTQETALRATATLAPRLPQGAHVVRLP